MFASRTSPTQAYARIGIETGVPAADPHRLITMLFEGALVAVASARLHMEREEVAEKGQDISKAIDIVANGLKASLDMEGGGELAGRLAALYDYLCMRLLYANLKDDAAALGEVSGLLAELKGAWEEIAVDPAVVSRNKAAA